jgi:RNA polymerase sigma factor (sigma-70 family)
VTDRRRDLDADEFARTVEPVSADLLHYFERRHPQDAADLLAETLLVAWRRRRTMPSTTPEDARMWLFGTARNVLRNHVRSAMRRLHLADALRAELATEHDERAATDEQIELRQHIARLPADLAEVVTLAHWDGFTLAEIARLQNVPDATVRGRYRRARELLLRALSPQRG